MKTFKQFLGEAEAPQDAREFFEREAAPFIREAKGAGVLVRGSDIKPIHYATITLPSGVNIDVGISTVRKDRKPTGIPLAVHNVVDDWMQDQFGIAGRTGSVFVFGDHAYQDASGYGEVYVVIPQGDFKFIWSREVFDLIINYDDEIADEVNGIGNSDEFKDTIEAILDDLHYQTSDLHAAISSSHEIMIECDDVLMVRVVDYNILKELKEILR